MRQNFKQLFWQHRWTMLSLAIIVVMFKIVMFMGVTSQTVLEQESRFQQTYTTGSALIGGPFTMVSHTGAVVDESQLLGRLTLLFFGFTHCPDICPDTLSKLAQVYDQLDQTQREQVQVVFASVDGQRDTPEYLRDYVHAFHPDFVGLTGTPEQTETITQAFKVYAVRHAPHNPDFPEDYVVDHSGFIYALGTDGQYIRHFSHKSTVAELHAGVVEIL